ncbi:MAG: hypothetical protein KGH71_01595 [Candidatus Micrarchaeota archaeon]|nr:hypothetical protein [Candidatus Micrarchaeota archaeon]
MMMRINKDQDVKDLKDKIRDLYGKSDGLKSQADTLSKALADVTSRERLVKEFASSAAPDFDQLAELTLKNAQDYSALGLKHATKESYFESARYRVLEIDTLKATISPMMAESELTWENVGWDGFATFAAKSQEYVDRLDRIVTSANKAIWALERISISPREVTDEISGAFGTAYKAAYALGVYHFRLENAGRSSSSTQQSIGYVQYAMKFDIYSMLSKKSREEITKSIKDNLKRFSERYDDAIEKIQEKKQAFEEESDLFLKELEKDEKLQDLLSPSKR